MLTAKLIPVVLVINGIVHLLPVTGVLGAERLNALYGVDVSSDSIELLLRHRAVLFGILGCFSITAAFKSAWYTPALIAGLCSVVSFLILAWLLPTANSAIGKVIAVDSVLLVLLLTALTVRWWKV